MRNRKGIKRLVALTLLGFAVCGNGLAQAYQTTAGQTNTGVPAGNDPSCTNKYDQIIAVFGKGMTDEQIRWAFAYEDAAREGKPCPPNFPGAPSLQAQTSNQSPAPPMSESGEEWCLNGHRHYVKTDGRITYTSACHDHD
ncbi:hypothetical protein ACFOWX_06580 [Sphingorhabdus arenilitoris]|uniref:Uncharacterized protein n=1 Tax=Sphingorhabdus arenilitoris TaxID=1490041 RepID=A0ABV8RFG3_9SPHN